MQTPSPSFAPAPSSLASLSQQPLANQIQDHVTHRGSTSAGPRDFIWIPPAEPYLGQDARQYDGVDQTISPPNTTNSNGDAGWEDCSITVHNNSAPSTSCITTVYHITADTGCSSDSPSSLSRERMNHVIPGNYGQGNTQQSPMLENSQAFPSYGNLSSSDQSSQRTVSGPGVGWEENHGVASELCLQTLYPAADGVGDSPDSSQIINAVDMGILSSMPTGMDNMLQDSWSFYNPQVFPAQMPYPQMTLNTFPSPMGYPFQINATLRPRIYCPWPLCMESFARPGDLERHRQSVHLGIKYHCFWPGCHNNHGKGYVRSDKLRAHQKEKHGFA